MSSTLPGACDPARAEGIRGCIYPSFTCRCTCRAKMFDEFMPTFSFANHQGLRSHSHHTQGRHSLGRHRFRRRSTDPSGSLEHIPAFDRRPPAADIPAVLPVLSVKLLAQRQLFIEDDERMNAEGRGRRDSHTLEIRVTEHDPQSNPTRSNPNVYRIAHVTVESHNNQSFRREETWRQSWTAYGAEGTHEATHPFRPRSIPMAEG